MDIAIQFIFDIKDAFQHLIPSFVALADGTAEKQEMINVLGFTAGLLSSYGFVPQVIQTVKTKDTRSFSLQMCIVNTFAVSLWLLFGIVLNSVWMQLWNMLIFISFATILFYKVSAVMSGREPLRV